MLAIDPRLPQGEDQEILQFRKSMNKFPSSHSALEICEATKPSKLLRSVTLLNFKRPTVISKSKVMKIHCLLTSWNDTLHWIKFLLIQRSSVLSRKILIKTLATMWNVQNKYSWALVFQASFASAANVAWTCKQDFIKDINIFFEKERCYFNMSKCFRHYLFQQVMA